MKIVTLVFTVFFLGGLQGRMEKETTDELKLIPHKVLYKELQYVVQQAVDAKGVSQYYFIDISAFPCNSTKECKLTELRMYWDVKGYFLNFELKKVTPLTKLNHKKFTTKDYIKLHGILLDTSSDFKFLTLEDLTERQAEHSFYETDASSGATINSRDFECIHGAVKTSFQLWHFANGSLKASIKKIEEGHESGYLKAQVDLHKISGETQDRVSLIDADIRTFTEYLSRVKIVTEMERIHFENIAVTLLSKGGKQGLLMYNFIIRNDLKLAKRATKRFKKTILIQQVIL